MTQTQEFPAPLKLILLSTVLLLIILVPLFGYYQNNVVPNLPPPGCPAQYVLKDGNCVVADPYTLIWNGTITGAGSQTTGLNIKKQQSVAPTNDVNLNGGPDNTITDYRLEEAFCDNQLPVFTLARIDITLKRVGNPTGTVIGQIWDGLILQEPLPATNGNCSENNLNQNNYGTAISMSSIPTSYTTISFIGSFSILGSTHDYAIGVKVNCNGGCDVSNYITIGIVSVGGNSGENGWVHMTTFEPGNCAQPGTPACPTSYKYQYALYGGLTCPLGFNCLNSGLSLNNYATLIANATFPAVMLTTSTITTSTAASKELLFYETWGNSTAVLNNKPFAWYLTINSTLPQTQNYNPLTDPNVAMILIVYPSATNNYYVYQQKDAGSAVLTASGQSQNPYPTCPQTATLYICSHETTTPAEGTTNFLAMTTLLNYTGSGSNTGGAGSGTPNANSLLCENTTPANLNSGFCSTPGTPQANNPCSNPSSGICTTNTFPFLNVQGQYYLGFWSNASQTGNILFGTSNTGNVDKRANGVYYWVPNPSCPPTCAVTDTGGFFGWLRRGFDGAVNTVVTTVQNVGSWAQNTALGPIGDVLQGMVSWMISQIVNFLNWVGTQFGFPNLGSSLLAVFSDLVTTVTQVLLNFLTWVTNTGAFILNTLTFVVNIFANAVIFGLLAFVVGPALTLLNIILLMITLFFSFVTPTSYLLMMDWAWGILMVYVIGVSGFLWWTDLNVQIFTFVFKMIWKFTELIWRGIVIVKSFIPTEGGTPGDLKDPTPSGGPKGGSGSGGKPETKKPEQEKTVRSPKDPRGKEGTPHVPKSGSGFKVPPRGYGQGAKDGDPFAILLMGFMIIVALYWLSIGAFSPIGSQTVVGCIAWSTNCHVQNGVTVGTINTSVFFAYLFDQNHGVRIIFSLFVPLVVIMFAYWFMKNVVGEDKARGNDFLNIGGTVERTRTVTSRRETMKRYRKNREES